MKISVLGNIINTKSIYRISPIEEKDNLTNLSFTIYFFNQQKMVVKKDTCMFVGNSYKINDHLEYMTKLSSEIGFKQMTMDEIKNSEDYKDALTKITKLRNEVVSYWEENKSDIPELEF